MTPILIRSKDRVDYLYTTLKSLTGTILNDAYVVIVDDCSESDEMKKFLYSNDEIKLKNIGWKQQIKNDVKEKSIYFFNPNNLTDNEIEKIMEENCGSYEFMYDEIPYAIDLENIWDICNYYLDYCNKDMTENELLELIKEV